MWEKKLLGLPIIVNTNLFSPITTDRTYDLNKCPLIEALRRLRIFQNPKILKTPMQKKLKQKFLMRLNDCKSPHKSFKAKKPGTQGLFRGHDNEDNHAGKDDGIFVIIDHCTAKLD